MKKFILLPFIALTMSSAFATVATVDDAFCGEIDPFVIGDACIVMVTAPANSKIAVLFNYDQFQEKFTDGAEALVGKQVNLYFDLINDIRSKRVKAVLKDFGNEYYFMKAHTDAIQAL